MIITNKSAYYCVLKCFCCWETLGENINSIEILRRIIDPSDVLQNALIKNYDTAFLLPRVCMWKKVSYLMFNFPKLCCSFYESPTPPSPSSISPTFTLSFSLSPTPYIVLEEGVTFRQGEENTLPTNIGTEANKSRDSRGRRAHVEIVTLGLGKSSKE